MAPLVRRRDPRSAVERKRDPPCGSPRGRRGRHGNGRGGDSRRDCGSRAPPAGCRRAVDPPVADDAAEAEDRDRRVGALERHLLDGPAGRVATEEAFLHPVSPSGRAPLLRARSCAAPLAERLLERGARPGEVHAAGVALLEERHHPAHVADRGGADLRSRRRPPGRPRPRSSASADIPQDRDLGALPPGEVEAARARRPRRSPGAGGSSWRGSRGSRCPIPRRGCPRCAPRCRGP